MEIIQEMGQVIGYLRDLNLASLVVRLLVAVACGGVIGYERGKHQEAAGLRTHILVCTGAACAMIVGQFTHVTLGGAGDPTRIGAQVVSGIGFIGAGTIIQNTRHQIKGVTTAAGLWASAAMGLAAGIGFFECAAIMCLILHITLRAMNRMDDQYIKHTVSARVYIEYEKNFRFSEVIRILREGEWKIQSIEPLSNSSGESVALQFVMQGTSKPRKIPEEALKIIREMDGVWFIEEL